MRVLIQWTLATPQDWETVDSSDWLSLPKKRDPTSFPDTADRTKGWIHCINVQGVCFSADHYHIVDIAGGIRVTTWNDNPTHHPIGLRHARVWDILNLRPDPRFGGAINTKQRQVVYAEPGALAEFTQPLENTVFKNWLEFSPPNPNEVIHNVEIKTEIATAHRSIQSIHGWREWIDGLEADELNEAGSVKSQRGQGRFARAQGTRTYFARDIAQASGQHPSATDQLAFLTTTGVPATVSETTGPFASELSFLFTTPLGEPDSPAWPTGNYRCQLDCISVGVSIIYGLLALVGGGGHFARVRFDLPSPPDFETKVQIEAAFNGTGLKLATTGSVPWSPGDASDRFECVVQQRNFNFMASESVTLEVNESDDFADGPWPAAVIRHRTIEKTVTCRVVDTATLTCRVVDSKTI